MKKVIINADDFGYSSGVNQGIIKSHQQGILTSTTLMANMPEVKEAIKLSKENPNLGVGVHLVLTTGKAMASENTNLVEKNGYFYKLKDYSEMRHKFSDQLIFKEWSAQIDYLLSLGLEPTHFDSHHHVHFFPENHDVAIKISKKYGLPFRSSYGVEDFEPIEYDTANNMLLDMMNTSNIRDMTKTYGKLKSECLKELNDTLLRAKDVDILELMVHPAFVDEFLYHNSSFNIQRMREVEILTDPDVKTLIENHNYKLVNFKTIED